MKLSAKFFSVALIIGISLIWSIVYALDDNTDKQKLKQEIIRELLQSDELRQKILDEIKTYQAQNPLQKSDSLQPRQSFKLDQIQKQLRPVSSEHDQIYGNKEALINVVEYSDFECPYCRKIHPVLKRLVDDSEGKINWVFRHFPLSMHKPNAQQEAEAAECAGHLAGYAGFWKFTDALFQQPRRGVQDRQSIINRAIALAELNKEDIMACLNSGQFKEKVENDEKEALSLGLQGTPANVLVNRQTGQIVFRQGAASLETFSGDAKQLLEVSN